jgi:hypothetical protein
LSPPIAVPDMYSANLLATTIAFAVAVIVIPSKPALAPAVPNDPIMSTLTT